MTNSTAIGAYWDGQAAVFDDEADHGLRDDATRAAWAARLESWIGRPAADVLDVGCGTGSLTCLLAAAGHRVTGVDLAPRMVERARAKAAAAGLEARLFVGDAAVPPTGDDRFDVVLSRHLVWTLPEPEAALREWVARLRPGGVLVLVEGRWGAAAPVAEPYGAGTGVLPWSGGVGAEALAGAVRPLVADVRVEDLGGDEQLWGRPVTDERYVLMGRV
ncbi:class I SAM-dependent methyltransferase [Streptomyces aculeolatus]|uniref:class I SAM-dependent methyltransferase n=1 Tax=Streptomyces aculeolatus TaxID=270689 RepID=UPI001CEC61EF|nr:class I SAM-dependent methyltransferase [Streptomyces aculeolatus]